MEGDFITIRIDKKDGKLAIGYGKDGFMDGNTTNLEVQKVLNCLNQEDGMIAVKIEDIHYGVFKSE